MRARNLKPKIFKNELLAVADPLYTIIFEGLWCEADREGRLEDRPGHLHLEINAGRAFERTVEALEWLEQNGFIRRYVADGRRLIHVINFHKHQRPHQNEKSSELPPPPVATKVANRQPIQEGNFPPQEESASDQGTTHFALTPSSLTPDSGLLTADSLAGAIPTKSRTGGTEVASASDSTDREMTPEAALAVPLRKAGVKVSSMHPMLCAWVRDGITVRQALSAVAIARESKQEGEIPAKYLDKILRDLPEESRSNGANGEHGKRTKFDRIFGDRDSQVDEHGNPIPF